MSRIKPIQMKIRLGRTTTGRCRRCGKEYLGTNANMRYCCLKCRYEHNLDDIVDIVSYFTRGDETSLSIKSIPENIFDDIESKGFSQGYINNDDGCGGLPPNLGNTHKPKDFVPSDPWEKGPSQDELRIIERMNRLYTHRVEDNIFGGQA